MTVSFESIPSDILTPGHFVEIDSTGAIEGSTARPHTTLLVGYRLPAGTVAENIPKLVTKAATAEGYYGIGSQVANMTAAYLNVDERTKLYVMGIDSATGTNATGSIDFTGSTPTATGVVNCYIGGARYSVAVSLTSTATTLGDALVTAIGLDTKAEFTAVNTLGDVAITYKVDGIEGNYLDLRVNYRDTDETPAGVSVAVTAMASGAGATVVTDAIAAMAGAQYDTIVCGLMDDTSISAFESELADRWGPMVDLDGHLFVGFTGDYTATYNYTVSTARNSEQSTVACPGQSPTPPWIVAAQAGANDAAATQIDPARPRHTLRCPDVLAPAITDRFTQSERNLLLQNGAATLKTDPGGNIIIERLTTTYQKNAQGAVDRTWLDLSTKRTVSYLRWNWDNRITRKYPRHKLADDGTRFNAGQAIVTPSTIRGEAIAWFTEMEGLGLVEGADQFREDLIVERNTTDFNRIDAILRPNTINGFVVSATKLQFRL